MPPATGKVLLEFVVQGPPFSAQARRQERVREWKSRVADAARNMVPPGNSPSSDSVQISITHYYDMRSPDLDNLAGPILDALQGVAYGSDQQVSELSVRRLRHESSYKHLGPSPVVMHAHSRYADFVHVVVALASS